MLAIRWSEWWHPDSVVPFSVSCDPSINFLVPLRYSVSASFFYFYLPVFKIVGHFLNILQRWVLFLNHSEFIDLSTACVFFFIIHYSYYSYVWIALVFVHWEFTLAVMTLVGSLLWWNWVLVTFWDRVLIFLLWIALVQCCLWTFSFLHSSSVHVCIWRFCVVDISLFDTLKA